MKKKYSTLLNFALATCVATTLVACSDGDFTGSTGSKITGPKIDIGGAVVDTNGNPLEGVGVSCQGSNPVKTNALGTWVIRNLKVTNVAGADDYTSHPGVRCVVETTAGYLGAIVSVYPEAQIDDTPSNWNYSGDFEATNPRTAFIDGMYAEAGTAWLPALGSTVKGRV
ncbi:MAG: hypothetical protein AMJ60_10615, partial [Desulfobacterales bacterium SG8_35]